MQLTGFKSTELEFFAHICNQYEQPPHTPNKEAFALFCAVQDAFSILRNAEFDKHVPVDPELVSYLAACGWVALGYDKNSQIPWETSEHDYILGRTFSHFLRSLVLMWRKGLVWTKHDGASYCGEFRLPPGFEEWAKAWVW